MKLNKVFAIFIVLAISTSGAQAMFLGDYFQNTQTRVSYILYKPSNTAGLKLTSFKVLECGAGLEQWVAIKYGSGKKFIEILQNMSGKPCSDPGLSKKLANTKVNKLTAQVRVYCDPSKPAAYKKCTSADIAKVGGFLMFSATNKVNRKAT